MDTRIRGSLCLPDCPGATPRQEGAPFRLQGGLASLNVARGPREIAVRSFRSVQSYLEISVIRWNDFSRRTPPPSRRSRRCRRETESKGQRKQNDWDRARGATCGGGGKRRETTSRDYRRFLQKMSKVGTMEMERVCVCVRVCVCMYARITSPRYSKQSN